jgi:hypothetical protein
MSIQVPQSLLKASDSEAVIDAAYFVVRALRNATRGYPTAIVSSEPSPEARDLAERSINEIEVREKRPIRQLSRDRIDDYIASLEDLQRTRYLDTVGSDTARAESILEEMRSSEG